MQLQRIVRLALSGLILGVLLIDTSGLYKYPFVKQLENWTYDARLNFTRPDSIDDRIVIVDIDENSLAEVGRWPWGRDKLARIVDNLFNHYQVDVVGFDIDNDDTVVNAVFAGKIEPRVVGPVFQLLDEGIAVNARGIDQQNKQYQRAQYESDDAL